MNTPIVVIKKWFAKASFNKNRADFYYDLAASLEDRVPLFSTFRKLESRARRRKSSESLVYMDMVKGLDSGSLSKALESIAPSTELVLIDALQSAGDAGMAEGLKFLSTTVEKTDSMKSTAQKAIIYPLSLMTLFGAMLTGFSVMAVPILASILPPDQWPFMGKILYKFSMLIVDYGIFILLSLIIILVTFFYSLPRWYGPVRTKFDNYLPYSFYRDYTGAMLIVSLASLMRNGISLSSALDRSIKNSNPRLRSHLREILRRLANPQKSQTGDAFKTGCLNKYFEDRVEDAFDRRNPVEAFVKIGVGSLDRVIAMMESAAAKLSSMLLVICGILLMVMMTGFFTTTMELKNGIRNISTATKSTQSSTTNK